MGKIIIKSEEEIAIIKANGEILANALAEAAKVLKPGVNGLFIDKIVEQYILDHGAKPSFKGLYGFPASVCISINEDVVHGIPNARIIKEGDIVSLDAGVYKNEFHADSAYTIALEGVNDTVLELLKATKASLYLGISFAIAGNKTGDIGFAIQEFCEIKNKYKCVRELVGHGLGRSLHEDPQVPNYGKRDKGDVLPENCVIAIEPMINMGRKDVYTKSDKWTIATQDHKPSAHYEHTICVKNTEPIILTSFTPIEVAIASNKHLLLV